MTLFLPKGGFNLTNEEAEKVTDFVKDILNPLSEEYDDSTAEILANSMLEDTYDEDTGYSPANNSYD